jgi:hypothetical protein
MFVMHCRNIKPLLADYANGVLSASESSAVQSHLNGCPDCADEAGRYQQLFSGPLAREVRETQVDWPEFGVRLNQRIDDAERGTSWLFRPLIAMPAAAVLLLAVIGLLFFDMPLFGPDSSRTLYSDMEHALGEEVLTTLPYEMLDDIAVATGSDAGLSITSLYSGMLDADVVDDIFADVLGDGQIAVPDVWLTAETDLLSSLTSDEADEIIMELQTKTFFKH